MTKVTAAETPDQPDQPDHFAAIAAELRRVADDIETLVGSGLPKPDYLNLGIQPGTRGNGDSTATSVDALAVALTGKPGGLRKMSDGGYHYSAKDVRRGLLSVSIYQSVPTEWAVRREAAAVLAEREAELEKLRAEVAELRAAALGGGQQDPEPDEDDRACAHRGDGEDCECGGNDQPADPSGLGYSREADDPTPVSPARVPLHTGGVVGPVDGGELVDDAGCAVCGGNVRVVDNELVHVGETGKPLLVESHDAELAF